MKKKKKKKKKKRGTGTGIGKKEQRGERGRIDRSGLIDTEIYLNIYSTDLRGWLVASGLVFLVFGS